MTILWNRKAQKPVSKKKKFIFRCLTALIMIVALCGGAFGVYVSDYYHADQVVLSCLAAYEEAGIEEAAGTNEAGSESTGREDSGTENLTDYEIDNSDLSIIKDSSDNYVFSPKEDSTLGLIFYPGGKVEYRAYVPLMADLAKQGITCILLKVPCNLAILDIKAAEGIQQQYPEITHWYLGGHSLGGTCAAMYLADHPEDYDGLLLLGAYSTKDLQNTSLKVLSIYGEKDGVMNRENYEKDKANLPDDFTEYVIEGGCHAYFGSYGAQKGDGEPTITAEEQQEETAELAAQWMKQ